jgi:hypothetical protein
LSGAWKIEFEETLKIRVVIIGYAGYAQEPTINRVQCSYGTAEKF